MSDFESAIHNASRAVFPTVPTAGCLFHLGQNIYRNVQSEGLQTDYQSPADDSIRKATHMLISLAFLPPADVIDAFEELQDDVPGSMKPILQYFDDTYLRGRPRRGRRAAVPPPYRIGLWNQYDTTVGGFQRTNNLREGWHNRLNLLTGKAHPDLYSFLKRIKKEQQEVDVLLVEVGLGRSVRPAKKKRYANLENRIKGIVDTYETYRDDNRVLDYLQNLGRNFTLFFCWFFGRNVLLLAGDSH